MITLTYDPKKVDSYEAWYKLPQRLNNTVIQLKDVYKDKNPQFLYGNEPHKNGYPHTHIMFYADTTFQQYPNINEPKMLRLVKNSHRTQIKQHWPYGHIDVSGIYNKDTTSAVTYAMKYALKQGSVPQWLQQQTAKEPQYDVPGVSPNYNYLSRPRLKYFLPKQHLLNEPFDPKKHVIQDTSCIVGFKQNIKNYHAIKKRSWSKGFPKLFTN